MKKRIISFLLAFSMLATLNPLAVAQTIHTIPSVTPVTVLQGVRYGNEIIEISSAEQYNAQLLLDSVIFNENEISIAAMLLYNEELVSLGANGVIYNSMVTEDAIVALLDDNSEQYEIISFVIEFSPKEEFLLLPTKIKLEEGEINSNSLTTVIKIAVLIGEDLFYFEDTYNMPLTYENDLSLSVDLSPTVTDDIYAIDRWFFEYLEGEEPVEVPEEIGMKLVQTLVSLDSNSLENSTYGIGDGTIVPAIDDSLFKSLGIHKLTTNANVGFYMNTISYPVGTENMLSSIIQWQFVSPSTVSRNSDLTCQLLVQHSGEYIYNADENSISKWSDYTTYKIGNAKVGAYLETPYSDIITKKTVDQQYSETSYTSAFVTFLGIFDRVSIWADGIDIITSLQRQTNSRRIEAYPETLEECHDSYGSINGIPKAVVAAVNMTPSGKYLHDVDDSLLVEVIIKKPTDVASYYTYTTGRKTFSAVFTFSIYQGSTAVLSNVERERNTYYY